MKNNKWEYKSDNIIGGVHYYKGNNKMTVYPSTIILFIDCPRDENDLLIGSEAKSILTRARNKS